MTHIAVVGFGNIGGGVVKLIDNNQNSIAAALGDGLEVKYIVDIRDFTGHPLEKKITPDFNMVLNDPEVSLVVETIGGSHPAVDFSLSALRAGKHVVSSNKETVAKFGEQLLAAARENHVRYLFEASVGGGIPIIRPLMTALAGNVVTRVDGILNGTSNYILTQMEQRGLSMEDALKEAQAAGYAEANPSADIDGVDSCRKICILAAMASGKIMPESTADVTGIREITKEDIAKAAAEGKRIRLIASAEIQENGIPKLSVKPCTIGPDNPLYAVEGVFNAILVHGNKVGDLMFYGRGAGADPTASAVVADIIDAHTGNGRLDPVWTRVD